jgi:hypothetical protein
MKKITTLTLGCLLAVTASKAQIFSDDFESYTITTPLLGIQSANWRTWSSTVGGTGDDVAVVNTDNNTVGGSQSIYFSSTIATGGPADVVLPFGTTPITSGIFTFTSSFKIPAGKTGYFNFQGTAVMGNTYTLECWMQGGVISIKNSGGAVMISCPQPVGTWFELSLVANLTTGNWELFVNGVSQGVWANAVNKVFAIDIFPPDANSSYWVDDVSYDTAPFTLPTVNAAASFSGGMLTLVGASDGIGARLTGGVVGAAKTVSVDVKNFGSSIINSFDLSVNLNGGTPQVVNVTGLTLASLATTNVILPTPFTLVSGTNTFTATVNNVNGAGADGDATDDVISRAYNPIVPANGKVVVVEEATGTWCQWCPRGAVFMDLMADFYDTYTAGIAVHNGDPMTVASYDASMGALVSGYPSSLVDRLPEIDPGSMETDFLTRIVIAPKAFIVNGANYNSSTRVLNVSVTSTLQSAISGNYKIACVITEDSVSGTGSTYNQSNAYSGGGAGPMGGFELLGSPVAAALMNYNHVARFISPDFGGIPNAEGATTSIGGVFTWNFSFTLPASFDDTKIHIVGLFIDPTGKIDNAGTATIAEAVTNGYVSGSGVGVNDIASAPDAQVSIYPNPSSNNSTIALNLDKASTVSVAIYSVDGALAGSKEYGQLNGNMSLPVDMTKFNAGMYFVNVTINGNTTVLKLIKQ